MGGRSGTARLLRSAWARDPVILVLALAALPPFLEEFRLRSFGGYFAFAILALSLDLVWGYGGIISFAQGAFFGIGAYVVALAITRWDVSLAWAFGIVVGVVIGGVLALLVGWFVFLRRVGTFYVAVFTLAFSVVFQQLALQFQEITGGANGIIIPERVVPDGAVAAYYVMLAVFAAVLFLLVGIVRSDFGRVLVAVRDNEERARFLGYDTARIQRWAFAIGGAVASIAGAMYAPYVQLASADLIGFAFSAQILIWVAIGGRGSLVGAAAGALLVNLAQQELGATLLLYWQAVLGTAFVAVVLFAPDGLYAAVRRLARRFDPPEHGDVVVRPAPLRMPGAMSSGSILQVRGLGKDFGSFRVLDGVNLELRVGELRCLIGPNGAGKSTLVDILTGRTSASDGEAALFGKSLLRQSPDALATAGLRRKFQATNIFDTVRVGENLHLAATSHGIAFGSLLRRSHRLDIPEPVMELLRESGLLARVEHQAGTLSHGEKQWLELCMVLASEPTVVLLDEPTAGLTGEERHEIGRVLRRMTRQGLTVMLIEHDFGFVRNVADRVTVLHQGRVVAEGSVAEISESATVRSIYLGTTV